ncbi:DUF6380 family protein [Streptomyces poriticola]
MTCSGTPAAEDAARDERTATLHWRAASLTETVGRTPFDHCRRAGEGAR